MKIKNVVFASLVALSFNCFASKQEHKLDEFKEKNAKIVNEIFEIDDSDTKRENIGDWLDESVEALEKSLKEDDLSEDVETAVNEEIERLNDYADGLEALADEKLDEYARHIATDNEKSFLRLFVFLFDTSTRSALAVTTHVLLAADTILGHLFTL